MSFNERHGIEVNYNEEFKNIKSLKFSTDEEKIAIIYDNKLVILDWLSGHQDLIIELEIDKKFSIQGVNQEQIVLKGDQNIQIYDTRNGTLKKTISIPNLDNKDRNKYIWSPDSKAIVKINEKEAVLIDLLSEGAGREKKILENLNLSDCVFKFVLSPKKGLFIIRKSYVLGNENKLPIDELTKNQSKNIDIGFYEIESDKYNVLNILESDYYFEDFICSPDGKILLGLPSDLTRSSQPSKLRLLIEINIELSKSIVFIAKISEP